MQPHKAFVKQVVDAIHLKAQTCRALGPESQEDFAVYTTDDSEDKNGN